MDWTMEAEEMIKKAPFFVRSTARKKSEELAKKRGKNIVDIEDVNAAKSDKEMEDLSTMDLSIKGLKHSKFVDIDLCGGLKGCPFTLFNDEEVGSLFHKVVREERVGETIGGTIDGPILMHKKFKGAVSGCPNSCSQPQIRDISILGYKKPVIKEGHCIGCKQCVKVCPEKLVSLDIEPTIDLDQCLDCGKCIDVCPTGSIGELEKGYRIFVGGKLGRVPRLARRYKDVLNIDELEDELRKILIIFKDCVESGKRFSDII